MSQKPKDSYWKIEQLAGICPRDNEIVNVQVGSGKDAVQAIRISSLTSLIQTVGYLKYRSPSPVYFRGQRAVHESGLPKPSLYRDNISTVNREKKIKFEKSVSMRQTSRLRKRRHAVAVVRAVTSAGSTP